MIGYPSFIYVFCNECSEGLGGEYSSAKHKCEIKKLLIRNFQG